MTAQRPIWTFGHYERFIDESLTKNSNVTTGKVCILERAPEERRGDFGGGTVQVIPITNEIKAASHRNYSTTDTEVAIIEVGRNRSAISRADTFFRGYPSVPDEVAGHEECHSHPCHPHSLFKSFR